MKICTLVLRVAACVTMVSIPGMASAGFLDVYNKANRAVQQTTGTIENTDHTINRAGRIVNKYKKPAQPAAKASPAAVSMSLTDKDKTAIEKAKRAWVAAFKAEDWDALVDQYAPDAVLLPPEEEATSGHEAIRANFATEDDTSNESFKTISIDGGDNIAYVQGTFSFTIKSGDNPPIDASGKYIEIWQKQPDGTWLITHDIWNANPLTES